MKSVLSIVLLTLITSTAYCGEIIYVCGTTDRIDKFFEKAKTLPAAKLKTKRACAEQAQNPAACIAPICRRVFLPTKVSELPKATQRRLAREDREAQAQERQDELNRQSAAAAADYADQRSRLDELERLAREAADRRSRHDSFRNDHFNRPNFGGGAGRPNFGGGHPGGPTPNFGGGGRPNFGGGPRPMPPMGGGHPNFGGGGGAPSVVTGPTVPGGKPGGPIGGGAPGGFQGKH